MGQQMMQGDGALVVGYRADELAHRIGHAQLPHHLQLQDRRGGELLGHRHDVVGGVAPGGDLRLSIGEAEAPAVRDLTVAGGDHRAAGPVGQGVVEDLLYRGINTPRLRGGRGRVLAAVPARGESEHGHEEHDEGTRTSYRVGPTHLPPFYNGTQIAPPVQSLSTNYREPRTRDVRRIRLLETVWKLRGEHDVCLRSALWRARDTLRICPMRNGVASALIFPNPPEKGAPGFTACGRSSTASSMCSRAAVLCDGCPRTSRPGRPSTTGSGGGAST